MRRGLTAFFLATMMVLAFAGVAGAAHNGNNKAALTGTGDPDATGQAIVNYREGTGTFNGTITVSNLTPGEMYTFLVRRGAVETVVCSGTANSSGVFTCSAQDLALPGFVMAVVRDSAGIEVATGTFARRGNCRDADQAGSQCAAPGQTK